VRGLQGPVACLRRDALRNSLEIRLFHTLWSIVRALKRLHDAHLPTRRRHLAQRRNAETIARNGGKAEATRIGEDSKSTVPVNAVRGCNLSDFRGFALLVEVLDSVEPRALPDAAWFACLAVDSVSRLSRVTSLRPGGRITVPSAPCRTTLLLLVDAARWARPSSSPQPWQA